MKYEIRLSLSDRSSQDVVISGVSKQHAELRAQMLFPDSKVLWTREEQVQEANCEELIDNVIRVDFRSKTKIA